MSLAPLGAHVTVFHGKHATDPAEQLPLGAMLERIRTGTYRTWIAMLRQYSAASGKKRYSAAKAKSHAFTPCCALSSRAKDTEWADKLLSTTGLVHYDLDGLDDAAAARATLAQDPRVVFAFISPSGHGLKVGVLAEGITDPATYKAVWAALRDDFRQRYPALSVSTDIHVKYLNALCYVSDDPDVYVNPNAVPFVMPPQAAKAARTRQRTQAQTTGAEEEARALEALRYIRNDDVHYDTWLTIGMALHSSGEAWARGAWDAWSQQSAKYDAREQDSTWGRLTADGGVTMGTLYHLAKEGGYRPPEKPRRRASAPASVPLMGQTAPASAPAQSMGAPPAVDPDQLLTDNYNARALVKTYGNRLRYCYPWKGWLTWTGTHWQRDTSGQVMRWARQTIKGLAQYIVSLEDAQARALLAHIKSSLSTARLKAMVEQAQSAEGIPVQPEDLDRDPWLLNCTNGTVDLRNGQRYAHRKEDLLTMCLDLAYDPTATCPDWHLFLWRIMGGTVTPDTPDMGVGELERRRLADTQAEEMIDFLRRAIGYCLTGSTREQCLFILYGITKTGKSTFLAVLRTLLGPYGTQADMETFMHKDRHEVRNDLADLDGKRVVCAVESQEGRRLNENLIKQLTGGADAIKARFLFEEYFTFKPQFKIFIGTNHKPVIRDTDAAIWERIRLIPFEVQIPLKERNKHLEAALLTELPGILAWAVQGCKEWQRHDELREPDAVTQATQGYRAEMDDIGRFLQEVCVLRPEVKANASRLLKAYQQWSGQSTLSPYRLAQALTEKGYVSKREHTGMFWYGIGVPAET